MTPQAALSVASIPSRPDDDLAKRKEAAALIQRMKREKKNLAQNSEFKNGQLAVVQKEPLTIPRTVTEDERLAFEVELAATLIDNARKALSQYQKSEMKQEELAHIIQLLFDQLETIDGIPEWGFPTLRPLGKFQRARRLLRAKMDNYYKMANNGSQLSTGDPVADVLRDPTRFSKEFDELEMQAVSLREFLRAQASKLRKRKSGIYTVLSDQDIFNRDNIDLVASVTLGFLGDEVDIAVARLNRMLNIAGVDTEIDVNNLTKESLKKVQRSVAEALHPDKNVGAHDNERALREDNFKKISQLIEPLETLLRQRKV